MIKAGDLVVAIRPGGQDNRGLPFQVPEPGQVYRITSIYRMHYGLGCTIEGLDPFPYRGFFLYVKTPRFLPASAKGWYFRKVVKDEGKADEKFIASLKKTKEFAQ